MAGFANLYVCNGLRQFDDVTFDVGVDLHSKNADPITGAAGRDPLVERQHFLEHARGPPVRRVRSPLRLEIFQLQRDAAGQGFGQGDGSLAAATTMFAGKHTTRVEGSSPSLCRKWCAKPSTDCPCGSRPLCTAGSGSARSSILSPASQPTRIAPWPKAIAPLRVSDPVETGCGRGAR